MRPLEEIYPDVFFRTRHRLAWKAPFICEALQKVFHPKTVIDAGCGVGDIVEEFIRRGVFALGIEGSKAAFPRIPDAIKDRIILADLRYPVVTDKFDLAVSFEVAEHIEPEYASFYISNLTMMSNTIVMSIARPGQIGRNHVNLQELSYWNDLLLEYKYLPNEFLLEEVRKLIPAPYKDRKALRAIYRNMVVYEKFTVV